MENEHLARRYASASVSFAFCPLISTILWAHTSMSPYVGLYSTVTIELSEGKKGCDMKLVQENVPEAEAERTQQAWRENIFERLKRLFGYGMGYTPF